MQVDLTPFAQEQLSKLMRAYETPSVALERIIANTRINAIIESVLREREQNRSSGLYYAGILHCLCFLIDNEPIYRSVVMSISLPLLIRYAREHDLLDISGLRKYYPKEC